MEDVYEEVSIVMELDGSVATAVGLLSFVVLRQGWLIAAAANALLNAAIDDLREDHNGNGRVDFEDIRCGVGRTAGRVLDATGDSDGEPELSDFIGLFSGLVLAFVVPVLAFHSWTRFQGKLLRLPRFVLCPPGIGKTSYVAYVNNPFRPGGSHLKRPVCDGDAILKKANIPHGDLERIIIGLNGPGQVTAARAADTKRLLDGLGLLDSRQYYLRYVHDGYLAWNVACFGTLIKKQHEEKLGPILCSCLYGGLNIADGVADAFDDVVGDFGRIDRGPAKFLNKVRPEEMTVVLPRASVPRARGGARAANPTPANQIEDCIARHEELVHKHRQPFVWLNGIREISDLPELCF